MTDRPTLEADLARARQNNDATAEAACLMALGHLALEDNAHALAQGLYGQALTIFQRLGDQTGTAAALVASGNLLVYGSNADMHTAVNFFQQALTLYQALGDERAQAGLYVRLGFLLWNLNINEARFPLYHQARALFEQIKDPIEQSKLAIELAGSMYGHPDFAPLYEKALLMHQQAEYRQGKV